MLATIRAFFAPSVDKILADFNLVVAKLQKAVDYHNGVAAIHAEVIKASTDAKAVAEQEVARAQAVAAKIKALLS